MATIKFENGMSVKFDGTPTEEDVNYVAQQLGIHPSKPKEEGATGIKGFGVGVLKGIGSTLSNLSTLGQKGLDAITKPIVEGVTGKPYQRTATANETFGKALEATTTSQKIGKTTEQIAEFFIPGGAATKVGKAVEGASLLSKAPAVVKGGAKLLAKAGTEATVMGGVTALQGGSAQDVKTNALLGGALPLVAPVLKGAGKFIAEGVIPKSAQEAKLIQAYKAATPFWDRVLAGTKASKITEPITAGSTAFKKGLMGTESMIGIQAKRGANNLWDNLIGPALKDSKVKVNMNDFFKAAKKEIISGNPEISRQKDLLQALDAMKADYRGIKDVPMKTLQKFKEGWAKFVPEKAYKGKPIAGAFNDVKDVLAGKARNLIYDKLGPEVKQAYFDYGNLKGLQELGQKAMTGSGLKGGFGSFWNTVKDMALVPTGTVGGQVLYKVGDKIEMYGPPGMKFVKELFEPSENTNP